MKVDLIESSSLLTGSNRGPKVPTAFSLVVSGVSRTMKTAKKAQTAKTAVAKSLRGYQVT